tara:strand:+ start:4256 stop:5350 length:1095 start_codon:yes stop_codon:yes gene_type:complete
MRSHLPLLFLLACTLQTHALEPGTDVESPKADGTHLIVGTKSSPPIAFKGADGKWTGLAIEMWRKIALQLGFTSEIREFKDLPSLLDAVERKQVDIAATAITMTANRDTFMDFSHTFAPANLGIAVLPRHRPGWWDAVARIFSWDFAQALLSLTVLLLITGFVLWMVERRRNAAQFGGPSHVGIGAAFWWSAVTMTTVGYGDKAPITPAGRVIALFWMFASVMVISGFTGAIASSLTVGQLQPAITSPAQLPYVTVGTLAKSTAAEWLDQHLISYTTYATTEEGLQALSDRRIEAFVNDDLVIRYNVRKSYADRIVVLTDTFDPGFYALGMPLDSERLKSIDIALLKVLDTPEWESLWRQYIGP